MAARQSARRQPRAPHQSTGLQDLTSIIRAAWGKSAGGRQERADRQLIPAHDLSRQGSRVHARAVVRRDGGFRASARWRMSSTSAGKGRVAATGRATITTATSLGICRRICRYASRIRRRTRLRATAPRTCRLTAKPTRRSPARCQSATKLARSCRLPCWKTAWNSAARRRRSPRGSDNAACAVSTAPC